MNKMLRIGLAVILIGIGMVVIFAIASGEDFFTYFNGDTTFTYVEKTYASDDFEVLNVSLKNKSVYILPSTDDQVKITYYENETDYITYDLDGMTLDVENEVEWVANIFNFNFFIEPDYFKLYLYLPESMELDLDLGTSNGLITISDLTDFGVLKLASSNGEITLDGIESSGNMTLYTSNGTIDVTNSITLGNAKFTTSNGKILVNGLEASLVDLHTSNGKIDCSNMTSDDIELSTSNGNIILNVPGAFEDHYLKMSTVNGNYYLNGDEVVTNSYHDSASKRIDCSTSNGNVSVNFSN
ncbi:MAG: DUF4097 domain-containing protein [Firmicutes bacterium]|nr:DUF4097 domain-containing protein [Bacillota bacterium]